MPTLSRRPLHFGRRFVANVIAGPAQAFVRTEASSGVVLLVATAVALLWANSPVDGSYRDLWDWRPSLSVGPVAIDPHLRAVVNDGLMAVFFLVVGLEIKRELLYGELASRRKAALPVAAALGGMAAPALIYTLLNAGGGGARGWGIPMATDIAFALGALALLGRRVPFSLKVFVLALAIVDDLGAIGVIALFYSGSLNWGAAAWVVALVAALVAANRAGLRSVGIYAGLGILLWLAVLESGVHATLAGVALAALLPSRPPALSRGESFERGEEGGRDSLDSLEERLHPWVSFLVVPLFALANAGIPLSGSAVGEAISSEVTLGVVAGLVVGKPLGIVAMAWLAVRAGWAELPENVSMPHILGAGLLAGIGFTVSLFIAGLAFEAAALVAEAKLGILGASLVAGICGFVYLWIAPGEPEAAGEPGA